MKRLMDFFISFTMLIMIFPVFLLITILIRVQMGRPIIFRQQRPGRHEQTFVLYKFRTMDDAADENGGSSADALRLTKLGTILRKYSLDELPQLFNVLKGEMSLVGPRPLLKEYLPLYTKEQALRHKVRPGITGWAQINGRNAITWTEKFELDRWYVENHSFLLDCKILLQTFLKVLKKEGINQQAAVTMEKFNGNQEVH